MRKYSYQMLVLILASALSACGGGDGENDTGEGDVGNSSVFNVPGDSRVARVDETTSDGDQFVITYDYDQSGRLSTITSRKNGAASFTISYTFSGEGKLLSRLIDFAAASGQDRTREYVYDGNRPVGYFVSDVGAEKPKSAVQYRYSGDRIVGFDSRDLDPLADNPTLSDGSLASTGTYTFNESGHISRLVTQNTDGTGKRDRNFVTNAIGQRITHETRVADTNLVISSVWEYESVQCIEIPQGILSQWACVQTF